MDKDATSLMSVLAPTYNRAHTLVRCNDCLEAHIYRLFEWIIVDDGSRDGTEALVLEFQNKASFPIYLVKKKNGGNLTTVNEFFCVKTNDCTNDVDQNCDEIAVSFGIGVSRAIRARLRKTMNRKV